MWTLRPLTTFSLLHRGKVVHWGKKNSEGKANIGGKPQGKWRTEGNLRQLGREEMSMVNIGVRNRKEKASCQRKGEPPGSVPQKRWCVLGCRWGGKSIKKYAVKDSI